jgi:hypothetical protein
LDRGAIGFEQGFELGETRRNKRARRAWSETPNGSAGSNGRLHVFLTGDKNPRCQQRIETRQIAIFELPFTRLQSLEPYQDPIRAAIRNPVAGDDIQIES